MFSSELLKQVRQIEIRTKGLVNEVFGGEYHSVFKGRGVEFAEVRQYQAGDDVRSIDWNVTARTGEPYVKLYTEERELTLMLLVDMSRSLIFGTGYDTKKNIAAEISAILALSAMKNNDKVGMILFTDKIEKFIPPKKSRSHVLRMISEVLSFEPEGRKTDIKFALEFFNRTIKKRSIAFLISDFIDDGFESELKISGRKHDLVGMVLSDGRERRMPKCGLLRLRDSETGRLRTIDSSDKIFQDSFQRFSWERAARLREIFFRSRLDSISINCELPYTKPIVDFFKARQKRC